MRIKRLFYEKTYIQEWGTLQRPTELIVQIVSYAFCFLCYVSYRGACNKVIMASFDIKSLFTNIPFDETIDIVNKCFYYTKFVLQSRSLSPVTSLKVVRDWLV